MVPENLHFIPSETWEQWYTGHTLRKISRKPKLLNTLQPPQAIFVCFAFLPLHQISHQVLSIDRCEFNPNSLYTFTTNKNPSFSFKNGLIAKTCFPYCKPECHYSLLTRLQSFFPFIFIKYNCLFSYVPLGYCRLSEGTECLTWVGWLSRTQLGA